MIYHIILLFGSLVGATMPALGLWIANKGSVLAEAAPGSSWKSLLVFG